jgi:hypothetical protein
LINNQATILQQQTIADTNTDWSRTVSFDQFDPAQGTLQGISLGVTADLTGSVSVESLEAAPSTISISQNGVIEVADANGGLLAAEPGAVWSAVLGAYDGIANYAGASGTIVPLSAIDAEVATLSAGGALSPFVGTGAALLTATASTGLDVTGPTNMQIDSVSRSGAQIDLQYDYTPSVVSGSGSYGGASDYLYFGYPEDATVGFDNAATSAPQILTLTDSTTGSSEQGIIDQFNPALGTLEAVYLTIGGTVSAGFSVENEDSSPALLTVDQDVGLSLIVAGDTAAVDAPFSTSLTLGAYDGTADFAGSSGTIVQDQTLLPATVSTLLDSADLAAFTGSGTLSATIGSSGTASLEGPAELLARLTADAGATASVSYAYMPAGVSVDPVAWGYPSDGMWTDAANWDNASPNPPASTDDVLITVPGTYTVTLDAAESLNSVVIDSPGATLLLDANLTAADNFILDAGTIDFNGGTVSAGNITLNGGLVTGGTIVLNASGTFGLGGASIVADETLALGASGYSITSGPTAVLATGAFTLVDAGSLNTDSGDSGGSGFVTVAECFARDTRIATPRGETPVEDLRVGDRVLLASGVPAPITWIGRRRIDCDRHPKPHSVWPVCIERGAFGGGLPHRDLFLSPDHAVFADGVLIPVKHLVNDRTIRQVPRAAVEYSHIELPRHAIMLAEGLTVESYLDIGKRDSFSAGRGVTVLHPDFASRVWEAAGCAPLVLGGPELAAVRRRLDRVADDAAPTHLSRRSRQ